MQQTILAPIELVGIGVHRGNPVTLRLHPAAEDTGLTFERTDLTQNQFIKAFYQNVVDTKMCTVLGNPDQAHISTIEHLVSALRGLKVDNVLIKVNADELPIMDGSALEFTKKIMENGVQQQSSPRKILKVLKTVSVTGNNDSAISIEPSPSLIVDYTIDFSHPAIGMQHFVFEEKGNAFIEEISGARTFGFIADLEKLQQMGLARGASLQNAIGLDKDSVLNKEGLRYKDEFVRHKILDCIGDLYLAGLQVLGKVTAKKAGHAMHHSLLTALFADPSSYSIQVQP